MTDESELRRQVAVASVRAEIAESNLSALRRDYEFTSVSLGDAHVELARMRKLVEVQAAELALLRERLRAAETRYRQLSLDTLVRAVVEAIDRGGRTLEDRTITAAKAELRVGLRIDSGTPTVTSEFEPVNLSTLTVDVRPIPLTPAREALMHALESVHVALLDLQDALDRDFPGNTRLTANSAIAELGRAIGSAFELARLSETLAPLVASLKALAQAVPTLTDSASEVDIRRAGLGKSPSEDSLRALATAFGEFSEHLRVLPP